MTNIELIYHAKSAAAFMKALFKDFNPEIPDMSLNMTQIRVLVDIYYNERSELPMVQFSKHFGLEKGSFSTIVTQLQQKNLVVRKQSNQDRRIQYLSPTEDGKKLVRYMEGQIETHLQELFEGVSQEEKQKVLDALDTIENFTKKISERKN